MSRLKNSVSSATARLALDEPRVSIEPSEKTRVAFSRYLTLSVVVLPPVDARKLSMASCMRSKLTRPTEKAKFLENCRYTEGKLTDDMPFMAIPWNQVIVSRKLGLGPAPVEAAPPPAMAELAAVKPVMRRATPARAAAVYDTAETEVVLPLEICEVIQPTLSPLSMDVRSRVAEAAISGIENAMAGISPAYSAPIS